MDGALTAGPVLDLVGEDDAPELTALVRANRAFLAPWEPLRAEEHFTEAGQRGEIARVLAAHAAGSSMPCVIRVDDAIVGRITLSNVVRGPFLSADLGYWVAAGHNGQGVATAAVARMLATAFGELGLHRVQAGTLLRNIGSQRVLERNGFVRFGLAERYLRIAGRWQDHVLFQRLAD